MNQNESILQQMDKKRAEDAEALREAREASPGFAPWDLARQQFLLDEEARRQLAGRIEALERLVVKLGVGFENRLAALEEYRAHREGRSALDCRLEAEDRAIDAEMEAERAAMDTECERMARREDLLKLASEFLPAYLKVGIFEPEAASRRAVASARSLLAALEEDDGDTGE